MDLITVEVVKQHSKTITILSVMLRQKVVVVVIIASMM